MSLPKRLRTFIKASTPGPCVVCGRRTLLTLDRKYLHLRCEESLDTETQV